MVATKLAPTIMVAPVLVLSTLGPVVVRVIVMAPGAADVLPLARVVIALALALVALALAVALGLAVRVIRLALRLAAAVLAVGVALSLASPVPRVPAYIAVLAVRAATFSPDAVDVHRYWVVRPGLLSDEPL